MKDQVLAKALIEKEVFLMRTAPLFTWASGIQSPIYCDNRKTLSYPQIRKSIIESLKEKVLENFSDIDGIVGVATAGIPYGALLADALDLPFLYVRGKAKEHGKKNQIEGVLNKGDKLLVMEDVVSTGMSSLAAVSLLREEGATILGIATVYSHGLARTQKRLEEEKVKLLSLCNLEDLLIAGLELKKIKEEEVDRIRDWQKSL